MKTLSIIILILFFAILSSCSNQKTEKIQSAKAKNEVYEKEPNDSANYQHIKYDFYLSKTGQLSERKLVHAKDTKCNCLFEVNYDSTFKIYTDDTIIEKPLNTIIDIYSLAWIDSTEFSKDKRKVYYFHGNSDGGNREIVSKADPATFKRLCEYRWGIDKNYVFYKTDFLKGLNLENLQVLRPPDTSDHFVQYVKDDKKVFHEDQIVQGADAKTFKVVSGQKWDAEDKNFKYETGYAFGRSNKQTHAVKSP
jgi:hypothetical protein